MICCSVCANSCSSRLPSHVPQYLSTGPQHAAGVHWYPTGSKALYPTIPFTCVDWRSFTLWVNRRLQTAAAELWVDHSHLCLQVGIKLRDASCSSSPKRDVLSRQKLLWTLNAGFTLENSMTKNCSHLTVYHLNMTWFDFK